MSSSVVTYSPSTVRSYMHAWRGSPDISTSRPIHLDPIISAEYQVHLFRDCKLSPRTIEGQTAQRCDFCSLRRLDDHICPTRFRFPSATSGCQPF
jgi:hypothetical protein